MVEVNELHRQIRHLLARMELLSEAATAKLQSNPGKSKPSTQAPTQDGEALADDWAARFAKHVGNPEALQRLLRAGTAALELRRHGPPKVHDTVESEDWILTAYEGVDPETVALIETERGALCRKAYVIWLRRRNDRNDLGYPAAPSEGRVAFAKRLDAEGMKQAKIASTMGISQSTVSRLLSSERRDRAA